jgi:hypothetical protein
VKTILIKSLLLMPLLLTVAACSRHDNHGFDPSADPVALVNQAKINAVAEHKKILVIAVAPGVTGVVHWTTLSKSTTISAASFNRPL